jgi:Na+/H+ antiporter NhaD/arsenite permease-like protein
MIRFCSKVLNVYSFLLTVVRSITKDCHDMTNVSSAYLGMTGGATIGGIIR